MGCVQLIADVSAYHVYDNYVTYIVAMRPYFSRPRQLRRLLCVAAMSSLPQLRLRDGYREAEATLTRREADRERKRQKRAAKYAWCLQSR